MYRTLPAGRLVLLERTLLDPLEGILQQGSTSRAQAACRRAMLAPAVNADHHLDGPPFAFDSSCGLGEGIGEIHVGIPVSNRNLAT